MPFVTIIFLTLLAIVLSGINYSWSNWQPASCMPDHCFCEAQQNSIIRQPINTYSNLAFIFVGLVVFMIARRDWLNGKQNNLLDSHRAYPIIFGTAAIVIGVGSFFYHASLTFLGQWLDVMGMYLFASFALVYTYARLRPIRSALFVFAYVVMKAMLGYLLIVNPDARRQIFAAMVYGIIALEALVWLVERPKIKLHYFVIALGALALAYGIWIADEAGGLCDPASLLQGHAIWHLLGAASAFLLFLYYRSEKGKVGGVPAVIAS